MGGIPAHATDAWSDKGANGHVIVHRVNQLSQEGLKGEGEVLFAHFSSQKTLKMSI